MAGDWINSENGGADMCEEVFVKLERFPGYSISNMGRVRSERTFVKGRFAMRTHKPRVLKQHGCGKYRQYMFVVLSVDGVATKKCVAHLVAEAFIGERPELHDVDHIDGDTSNNQASNLRYLHRSINRGLRHG